MVIGKYDSHNNKIKDYLKSNNYNNNMNPILFRKFTPSGHNATA